MTFDGQGNLYIADNEKNVLYMLDVDHKLHCVVDREEISFHLRQSSMLTARYTSLTVTQASFTGTHRTKS